MIQSPLECHRGFGGQERPEAFQLWMLLVLQRIDLGGAVEVMCFEFKEPGVCDVKAQRDGFVFHVRAVVGNKPGRCFLGVVGVIKIGKIGEEAE